MDIGSQLEHLDHALLQTISTQFPEPLTERDRAQVHAYLVLAHAVLEEHLEAVFERYFLQVSSWLSFERVPIECVRLAYAMGELTPDEFRVPYRTRDSPRAIQSVGAKVLKRRLASNNGLKRKNVEDLSKCLGIDWRKLEDALNTGLSDLDTLGTKRGAAGHLSPFTQKVTEIAHSDGPDDVREWVENGRAAVESVKDYLSAMLRDQSPATLIFDWDGN